MKIACGSICFVNDDLEGMLRKTKEAGYEWVEVTVIPGWMHADLREMKPQALGERVAAHGLKLAALYPGGIKTGSREDPSDRRRAEMLESVEYISLAISAAEALRVENLVFTGPRRDTGDRELMIEGFKRLAERLSGRRVHICLENHAKNQIETQEDYASILAEVKSDNFAITLDTGHFTGSGIDGSVLIDRYPEKIRHMHLKDHIGARPVRFGEGETDNRRYLEKLAKIGYEGFLTVEVEHEGRTLEDVIAAREHVEGIVRQCTAV